MTLSIQQKDINFDHMQLYSFIGRFLKIHLVLPLCFLSCLTFGQTPFEQIAIEAINGELKTVYRTIKLSGDITKDELMYSGDKAEIKALAFVSIHEQTAFELKLDVEERLGSFNDTISIISPDGFVKKNYLVSYLILAPIGDVFKSYRNEFWPFKSQEQVFNLRIGVIGDTLSSSFDLLNFSGGTLDLSLVQISDSINVTFEPQEVPHNSFTRMSISLASKSASSLGFHRTTVLLKREIDTISYLPIQYSLVPAKGSNGPELDLRRDDLDYKVIKEGKVISDVVLVSNVGVSALQIFKVETNCACLKATISKTSIAPQQNAELRFKFQTEGRRGLERKTITLFTNDPIAPIKNILIKAHVK